MKRRELVIAIVLTIVIAFMDISGLPGVLLFQIAPWDIDPFIFPLMINFVLIGILAFIVLKWFCPNWRLGLSRENLTGGLKRYAPAGAVAGALSFLAFVVGLPLDYQPTVWKILFEGILYYVGVAAVEELYVRPECRSRGYPPAPVGLGNGVGWSPTLLHNSPHQHSVYIQTVDTTYSF